MFLERLKFFYTATLETRKTQNWEWLQWLWNCNRRCTAKLITRTSRFQYAFNWLFFSWSHTCSGKNSQKLIASIIRVCQIPEILGLHMLRGCVFSWIRGWRGFIKYWRGLINVWRGSNVWRGWRVSNFWRRLKCVQNVARVRIKIFVVLIFQSHRDEKLIT